MDERLDQFDEALDEALASYLDTPGIDGLEERVLAGFAEKVRRPRSIKTWAVALSAAASVVAACLFWWMSLASRQPAPRVSAVTVASKGIEPPRARTSPIPEAALVSASPARQLRMGKRLAEPKLPQFPTSYPLTSEERALISLAAGRPEHIPQTLTEFGSAVTPIQIAAVEIKPLALGWNTKEKRCCD